MSTSDKDIEINLHEMTYETNSRTKNTTVDIKCGPCQDGNHKACIGPDRPCAMNKHKGFPDQIN